MAEAVGVISGRCLPIDVCMCNRENFRKLCLIYQDSRSVGTLPRPVCRGNFENGTYTKREESKIFSWRHFKIRMGKYVLAAAASPLKAEKHTEA